eukprot:jgi/Bigna1/84413/fgenesh1_pg.135_\
MDGKANNRSEASVSSRQMLARLRKLYAVQIGGVDRNSEGRSLRNAIVHALDKTPFINDAIYLVGYMGVGEETFEAISDTDAGVVGDEANALLGLAYLVNFCRVHLGSINLTHNLHVKIESLMGQTLDDLVSKLQEAGLDVSTQAKQTSPVFSRKYIPKPPPSPLKTSHTIHRIRGILAWEMRVRTLDNYFEDNFWTSEEQVLGFIRGKLSPKDLARFNDLYAILNLKPKVLRIKKLLADLGINDIDLEEDVKKLEITSQAQLVAHVCRRLADPVKFKALLAKSEKGSAAEQKRAESMVGSYSELSSPSSKTTHDLDGRYMVGILQDKAERRHQESPGESEDDRHFRPIAGIVLSDGNAIIANRKQDSAAIAKEEEEKKEEEEVVVEEEEGGGESKASDSRQKAKLVMEGRYSDDGGPPLSKMLSPRAAEAIGDMVFTLVVAQGLQCVSISELCVDDHQIEGFTILVNGEEEKLRHLDLDEAEDLDVRSELLARHCDIVYKQLDLGEGGEGGEAAAAAAVSSPATTRPRFRMTYGEVGEDHSCVVFLDGDSLLLDVLANTIPHPSPSSRPLLDWSHGGQWLQVAYMVEERIARISRSGRKATVIFFERLAEALWVRDDARLLRETIKRHLTDAQASSNTTVLSFNDWLNDEEWGRFTKEKQPDMIVVMSASAATELLVSSGGATAAADTPSPPPPPPPSRQIVEGRGGGGSEPACEEKGGGAQGEGPADAKIDRAWGGLEFAAHAMRHMPQEFRKTRWFPPLAKLFLLTNVVAKSLPVSFRAQQLPAAMTNEPILEFLHHFSTSALRLLSRRGGGGARGEGKGRDRQVGGAGGRGGGGGAWNADLIDGRLFHKIALIHSVSELKSFKQIGSSMTPAAQRSLTAAARVAIGSAAPPSPFFPVGNLWKMLRSEVGASSSSDVKKAMKKALQFLDGKETKERGPWLASLSATREAATSRLLRESAEEGADDQDAAAVVDDIVKQLVPLRTRKRMMVRPPSFSSGGKNSGIKSGGDGMRPEISPPKAAPMTKSPPSSCRDYVLKKGIDDMSAYKIPSQIVDDLPKEHARGCMFFLGGGVIWGISSLRICGTQLKWGHSNGKNCRGRRLMWLLAKGKRKKIQAINVGDHKISVQEEEQINVWFGGGGSKYNRGTQRGVSRFNALLEHMSEPLRKGKSSSLFDPIVYHRSFVGELEKDLVDAAGSSTDNKRSERKSSQQPNVYLMDPGKLAEKLCWGLSPDGIKETKRSAVQVGALVQRVNATQGLTAKSSIVAEARAQLKDIGVLKLLFEERKKAAKVLAGIAHTSLELVKRAKNGKKAKSKSSGSRGGRNRSRSRSKSKSSNSARGGGGLARRDIENHAKAPINAWLCNEAVLVKHLELLSAQCALRPPPARRRRHQVELFRRVTELLASPWVRAHVHPQGTDPSQIAGDLLPPAAGKGPAAPKTPLPPPVRLDDLMRVIRSAGLAILLDEIPRLLEEDVRKGGGAVRDRVAAYCRFLGKNYDEAKYDLPQTVSRLFAELSMLYPRGGREPEGEPDNATDPLLAAMVGEEVEGEIAAGSRVRKETRKDTRWNKRDRIEAFHRASIETAYKQLLHSQRLLQEAKDLLQKEKRTASPGAEAAAHADEDSPFNDLSSVKKLVEFQMAHIGPYMRRDLNGQFDSRAEAFGFWPDSWQRILLDVVDRRQSALVCAPTSAGKTFVGYYAINEAVRRNKESKSNNNLVIYMAPTLQLLQQATEEIYARYRDSDIRLGLGQYSRYISSTGPDLRQCDVLMTSPEHLERLVFSTYAGCQAKLIDKVRYIIIDEVQYLAANPALERVMKLLRCPFLALSATVPNGGELKQWLQTLRSVDDTVVDVNAAAASGRGGVGPPDDEFPPELREELSTVANKRVVHLIRHPYRYADLGKHFYYPTIYNDSPHDWKFPAEILQMSPSECLELYKCIASLSSRLPPESKRRIEELEPAVYFASRRILKRQDVRKYERSLQAFVQALANKHRAAFCAIVTALKGKIPRRLLRTPCTNGIRIGHFPALLADLRAAEMLPAMVFCFSSFHSDQLVHELMREFHITEEDPEEVRKREAAMARIDDGLASIRMKINEAEQEGGTKNESKLRDLREKESKLEVRAQTERNNVKKQIPPIHNFAGPNTAKAINIKKHFREVMESRKRSHKHVEEKYWDLIEHGIGVYSNALDVNFRRLVVCLFRIKYLKVVIGGQELSVGISLPARTSVLCGSKFVEPIIYKQMAGRAGRRGYDLKGHVVFYGVKPEKTFHLLRTALPPIQGHSTCSVGTVLRAVGLIDQRYAHHEEGGAEDEGTQNKTKTKKGKKEEEEEEEEGEGEDNDDRLRPGANLVDKSSNDVSENWEDWEDDAEKEGGVEEEAAAAAEEGKGGDNDDRLRLEANLVDKSFNDVREEGREARGEAAAVAHRQQLYRGINSQDVAVLNAIHLRSTLEFLLHAGMIRKAEKGQGGRLTPAGFLAAHQQLKEPGMFLWSAIWNAGYVENLVDGYASKVKKTGRYYKRSTLPEDVEIRRRLFQALANCFFTVPIPKGEGSADGKRNKHARTPLTFPNVVRNGKDDKAAFAAASTSLQSLESAALLTYVRCITQASAALKTGERELRNELKLPLTGISHMLQQPHQNGGEKATTGGGDGSDNNTLTNILATPFFRVVAEARNPYFCLSGLDDSFSSTTELQLTSRFLLNRTFMPLSRLSDSAGVPLQLSPYAERILKGVSLLYHLSRQDKGRLKIYWSDFLQDMTFAMMCLHDEVEFQPLNAYCQKRPKTPIGESMLDLLNEYKHVVWNK